jgi:DNA relaxase NicK
MYLPEQDQSFLLDHPAQSSCQYLHQSLFQNLSKAVRLRIQTTSRHPASSRHHQFELKKHQVEKKISQCIQSKGLMSENCIDKNTEHKDTDFKRQLS